MRKSDKQDLNNVNLINVRDKTKLNFDARKDTCQCNKL